MNINNAIPTFGKNVSIFHIYGLLWKYVHYIARDASRIARMYIYDSYERYVDIFFQAKRLSRSKRAEAQPCKCN